MIRLALLTALIAGCTPAGATGERVEVWTSAGSVQCEPGSGISAAEAAARLVAAGVTPAGPARAGQDGMMRPAVCGGGDGRVWVIGIAAGDLARARAAGFAPLDELPG